MMKPRQPINKDMDLYKTIDLMAEGDPNVKKLLTMIAMRQPVLLLHLDDMNLRGPQIWTAFYRFCEGHMVKFEVCVVNRNKEMIDYVNKAADAMGYPIKAVLNGGAPR